MTAQDAQNALKNLFADTLQELLETEMDEHLGYEKHDVGNKKTTNSRNGKSKKRISSVYGQQEIAVPRDRQGEFEPVAVKKHQTNVTGIEDQIIALYAKGVSTREIQDHLQNVYGLDMSPGFISNVTNKVLPLVSSGRIGRYRASMPSFSWMPSTSRSSRTESLSTRQPTWSSGSTSTATRMCLACGLGRTSPPSSG